MSVRTMDPILHDVVYNMPIDDVAVLIGRHRGDVRAAIRSLLEERKRLLERLALADICLGGGLAGSSASEDGVPYGVERKT
ncbi:hypothetical protein [Pararhizobium arenae]|uniref:hypothetical protein n=1 Tax=Pararhizobium arenae TaxID=1856850 RepID=UPI00094B655F|nr:hypothetical protein [Pararhizobium arenae]